MEDHSGNQTQTAQVALVAAQVVEMEPGDGPGKGPGKGAKVTV